MSSRLPEPVQSLIDAFNRLPGIGAKMAARLTFHLLQKSDFDVHRFMQALDGIRTGVQPCTRCGHITDQELCSICRDDTRNQRQICVVQGPLDVIALEKTGLYHGRFHVLGGALSPIDGIGPDQLRVSLLKSRLESSEGEMELILATNPSLEGEATASYLQQLFAPMLEAGNLKVSRIARGLPMGSDIEYADPTTLARALEGRNRM
ncbi:recombination mediator RecR [soil metagenome]